MRKHFDIVIIGSGIGGLVSAVLLAKNGYKVGVLEKNQQIGGALQVFSRDKRIFDTGVHYIGGLDQGENLARIFHYLGIYDDLELQKLDDAFDIIRLPEGRTLRIGQGYENYRKFLIEDFPEEERAIDLFIEEIQRVCTYFPLYNLESDAPQTYYSHPEILSISAYDYVKSITQNTALIAAFLGNGFLYAGDYKRTPLHVVALILNSYIKGSYRLVNGGAQLTKALVKQLRKHGGELYKRKEVISGTLDDQKLLQEVQCKDGSTYTAKHFISNLHPGRTMQVIGEHYFMPATIKRIARLNNTVSSFVVNITLKENAFPYINHNIYDYFHDRVFDTVDYDERTWPHVIYSCTAAHSRDNQFAHTFSAMTYMKYEQFEKWATTFNTVVSPSDRGSTYEQFKQSLQQRILDRLFERFPDLVHAIENCYSSTPLTFRDYLGTPEGELYGIEKDFNNSLLTTINPKTKIPNLYLTGQNIVFHGILGATIGALVTSFNFVQKEDLILSLKED